MSRAHLYWTLHLGGWAVVLAGFVAVAAATGGIEGAGGVRAALAFGWVYAVAVGATHALRTLAVRGGWAARPLTAYVPRVVGTIGVLAVATTAAMAAFGVLLAADGSDAASPAGSALASALGTTAIVAALYGGWALAYFLVATGLRLADAERDRLALRALHAEARLRALEYHVNPHFLFNALNTVRALTRENPDEARRAVDLLAALLRRTLAAGEEPIHTLADELGLVRAYLDLEALRFGRRLHVRVEADDGVAGVSVPPLLVQTLVENAVTHGVARCAGGGEVAVRAGLSGDGTLTVVVENPVGPPPRSDGPGRPGTGLASVRERLALVYGPAGSLRFGVADGRATATLRLPSARA